METIRQAFSEGGIWMWAIFAAQMVSIAIIIERSKALFMDRGLDQQKLSKRFEEDILKGQIEKAVLKADTLPDSSPIKRIVKAGGQAALNMGGREEIQAKMDEVLFFEQSELQKRTEFLAMLGNVGTLMGLLGTIVGMIRSFASLSQADQATKANLLAAGISEAMHATAYGLIMAIPALVMYAVLQNRVHKLSDDMTQAAIRIYNLLSFHYDGVQTTKRTRTSKEG